MKWYQLAMALTTAGIATALAHRLIPGLNNQGNPDNQDNPGEYPEAMPSPPDEPNIRFMAAFTNWRLPRVMALDDEMNGGFVLTVVNLGTQAAKPYVSVTERGVPERHYLVRDDRLLEHNRVREIARWTENPTLRTFLGWFDITPKPTTIVEFGSGHWGTPGYNGFIRNDRIWWQVNVTDI